MGPSDRQFGGLAGHQPGDRAGLAVSPPATVDPGAPGYPRLLARLTLPPRLWVSGALHDADELAVAVVGTRRATPYGLAAAAELAGELAARGVTIISGLARGIDAAAHRAALDAGGRTVAVLGSGIDRVYPPEHAGLAREIGRRGAVVTQFAPGSRPLPNHFLTRNLTIAGLSLAVVVVEAGERSGALSTAGAAADLGVEVCAVPGQITVSSSDGCHALIRDGAMLARRWEDVRDALPEPWRRRLAAAEGRQPARQLAVSPGGQRVLDLLRADSPRHVDQLVALSGLPASAVSAALGELELAALARRLAGRGWVTVPGRVIGPARKEG